MEFTVEIISQKKIKGGVFVINLDEYLDVGTHWIALHVRNIEIIYFDSFVVDNIIFSCFKNEWMQFHWSE